MISGDHDGYTSVELHTEIEPESKLPGTYRFLVPARIRSGNDTSIIILVFS